MMPSHVPYLCGQHSCTLKIASWAASAEQARRLLLSRGIRPVVAPVSWRASAEENAADADAGSKHHTELNVTETKNLMANAVDYAKAQGMVSQGDMIVGVHRVVGDLILKIVECH